MISLYAYTSRSRAERVLWVLQELELEHQVVRLSCFDSESLVKVNPYLKVPCLIHDDFTLTESMAICRYLCGLTPNSLMPKELKVAARLEERILIGINELESHLWLLDQAIYIKRLHPSADLIEFGKLKIRNAMKLVEDWLENDYFIVGNDFTVADVLFYHLITWASGMYKIEINEKTGLYLERLEKRKAFPSLMKEAGSPASNKID
jgi:glutathione S-transferase